MKFAPIIDPAVRKPAPKPVRVDLRKAFGMGTGLWAVALVIMCAAGVIIGVLLLIWEHFDRWDYRRLGQ